MGRHIEKRVDAHLSWGGLNRRNVSVRNRHGTILGTERLPKTDPPAPIKRERLAPNLIAKTHKLCCAAFGEAIDGCRSPAFHRKHLVRLVHSDPAP